MSSLYGLRGVLAFWSFKVATVESVEMADLRYNFAANPGAQTAFLEATERYPALIMGQGGGKTWGGATWVIRDHCNFPGTNSLVIAPTYRNLRQIVVPSMLERFEEAGIMAYPNYSTMEILTPQLGSKVLLHSGLNAERITGFEVGRCWIDEPGRIPEVSDPKRNVWFNALARVRLSHVPDDRRRVCVTGTHEGKGTWFYRQWEKEKRAGYIIFRGPTTENPVNVAYAELLRAEYGPELAVQYIEGYAVSDSMAAVDYDTITACQSPEASQGGIDTLGSVGSAIYWGVDIGRSKSLTIVWGVVEVGEKLVTCSVIVMQRATFAEQSALIDRICRHPQTAAVCIDATYNPQTAEDAETAWPSIVEPVVFTATVKVALVEGIARKMQTQSLLIPAGPDAEDIVLDFYSVKRIVSAGGRVTYVAPFTLDGHADRFFAAALAVRAASLAPSRSFSYVPMPKRRTAGMRRF